MSPPDSPTLVNRNANRAERRHDPEVRGERDHRPGAGGDALDAGDDRDRALAHRLDHVAGHLGEADQLARVHLDQLADDLVDVAAAAEALALAADDQDVDVVAVGQLVQQVAQVGVATRRSAG